MKKIAGCIVAAALLCLGQARAEVTRNSSQYVSQPVFVPCTGEIIHVDGELHTLITYTINENHVSGTAHFQPQGMTGYSLITGAKYQGTGVTQRRFNASLQSGQTVMTFVNNFRIIGQGDAANVLVHQTTHITINANGVVTATTDNIGAECK